MTIRLAQLVYWVATAWLVLLPLGAAYLLFDINYLGQIGRENLNLPIQWFSVDNWQLYALWVLTALYAFLGYLGVYFLRRAFKSFAQGQWFDSRNSRSLRAFALLLVLQGIVKPIHLALASVLLSWNHPPGERVLSISVGSNELVLICSGVVLWVLSDLLVRGMRADAENRQFV